MTLKLSDVVRFRGDKLFDGAVNIDWFLSNPEKSRFAAESFVFHGPNYHGVTQKDIGTKHGHQLQDTASFLHTVVRSCYGYIDQPFTLAIAGYGTGKSHLAITIAKLLSAPEDDVSDSILNGVSSADKEIASNIRSILSSENKPCLVIALNGIENFDLTAEMSRQLILQLKHKSLDTSLLDNLRPRFKQAANLVQMSNKEILNELLQVVNLRENELLGALETQDEYVYEKVNNFFAQRGMAIRSFGGESIKELLSAVSQEYCGDDKPFKRLLILFDEFGRYTEFATIRSQIAGSGVLQHLFEGVQANADTVSFVGFIQFELNAYVQRIAPEYRNEILRYVTRYQVAAKIYLSINLETLIANLIEKIDSKAIENFFDTDSSIEKAKTDIQYINKWFPASQSFKLWNELNRFHSIIMKGCWPLSPFSTWFLYYLAAAGTHLQERSAIALLGNVFERFEDEKIDDDGNWSLSPVDLWSNGLKQELISSEEIGQRGSIAHAYSSVDERFGNQLTENMHALLRSIVISAKLGLKVDSQGEAIEALSAISGLRQDQAQNSIKTLLSDFNAIEWDDRFNQFEIVSDSVPRAQFLSYLRQLVTKKFDEIGKAKLFASKASQWSDLLSGIDCGFAEENNITTKDWRFNGLTSNYELLETHLKYEVNRLEKAVQVDEPKGSVIYCYVEPSRDPEKATHLAKEYLNEALQDSSKSIVPIFIVLFCDEEGVLGEAIAELEILTGGHLSEEEKGRFGNLIGAHEEKMTQKVEDCLKEMIKERRYVHPLSEKIESKRINNFAAELFRKIYKKILTFPFDGFSTARGNAADTCQELIIELLTGSLDYDSILSKPPKPKNRAKSVLNDKWGAFTKSGYISRRPEHPILKEIILKWDNILQSEDNSFIIHDRLLEVCGPPYGLNIASAGLVLGLFVAPRNDKLIIIKDGEQYAISQWVQDGIFHKKFINVEAQKKIELVYLGDVSSEWEALLDEWENAEAYIDRAKYYERAAELKNRIPIPPLLRDRYDRLKDAGETAIKEIYKYNDKYKTAIEKIDKGYDKNSVSLLSWGSVNLLKMKRHMVNEKPLWTDLQIKELDPEIDNAKQTIIQIFSDWLSKQAPKGDSLEEIGDFKHAMIRKIGGNLKDLGLDAEYEMLEKRTNQLIHDVEVAAEARHVLREINSFIDQNQEVFRIIRISKLRSLKDSCKNYSLKLNELDNRIQLSDISEARSRLTEFKQNLKKVEDGIQNRAISIWDSTISSDQDIKFLKKEIKELIIAYEGCESDLEDLEIMGRVLNEYDNIYNQLSNEMLSWEEFESLSIKLEKEAEDSFGDEEIPWQADETITKLKKNIGATRVKKSQEWIDKVSNLASKLSNMEVSEANNLYEKLKLSPAYLTQEHKQIRDRFIRDVEGYLESLTLEWLFERFKNLSLESQQEFILRVRQIIKYS